MHDDHLSALSNTELMQRFLGSLSESAQWPGKPGVTERAIAYRDEIFLRMAWQWQPIDTAPKDGTRILVATDDEVAISSWSGQGLTGWNDDYLRALFPRRWRSLPPLN